MDWQLVIGSVLVGMVVVGVVLALVAHSAPARPWSILAALSVGAMPVAIVLHNLVGALLGVEEAVFFAAALVLAPAGFALGTLGAGVALARDLGHRTTGISLAVAGAGMTPFALYGLFALVITTIEGGNPSYQGPIEAAVVPAAVLALLGGAASAVVSLLIRPGRPEVV